jgi:polyhydroxybutyrate depolymerase
MIVSQQMRKERQPKAGYCRSLLKLLIIAFSLSLGVYSQCLTVNNNIKLVQEIEKLASQKNDLEKILATADKSQSNKLKKQIQDLDTNIKLKQSDLDKLLKNLGTIKVAETMVWKVDNCYRQALVFAPTTNTPNGKHPLVFVFHGHNGTMQDTSVKMNIQAAWPEAIVVYPQGVDSPSNGDPEAEKSGWQRRKDQESPVGNRDLDLFDTMVTAMKQKFKVDDTQIFAAGFSNGANFCYLLWAQRSNVIAAIGEIAGGLDKAEHLNNPLPVLAIVGKNDTKNVPSNQYKTINNEAKIVDNIIEPGQPCEQNNTLFTCTLYRSTTRTPVKILEHDGKHEIPSWAGDQIVRFFKNHKQL